MLWTVFFTEYKWRNFKKEVGRLVKLGVLEGGNYPEWISPSLSQPKPKINGVRFLSEFKNINEQ